MNANDMSLGELLRVLPQVKVKLLEEDLPFDDVHSAGVWLMVKLTMDRLKEQGDSILRIIRFCSFIHGECILMSLIEAMTHVDGVIELVRKSGLLTVERSGQQ